MEHVGMDLGKRESQLAILTETGELSPPSRTRVGAASASNRRSMDASFFRA